MNLAESPVLFQKLPLQIQLLIKNPQVMSVLKEVTGVDLKQFVSKVPLMISKDIETLDKAVNKLCYTAAGGFIIGVALNFQIKRIAPSFLKIPIYFRIPIRIGVIGLPFLALYPVFHHIITDEIGGVFKNMEDRKKKLMMAKDLVTNFQVSKLASHVKKLY